MQTSTCIAVARPHIEVVRVGGCPVNAMSFNEAAAEICRRIETRTPTHVVFINAAKVVNYGRDPVLRRAIERADLLLADGVPVVWASRLLRKPLPGRVNGTDLMEEMVRLAAERGYRVYFLGARPDVLRAAVAEFQRRYPRLTVAGNRDGYFTQGEEDQVIAEIAAADAQLLFLAISTPKKEAWADANLYRLGSVVCQGVGGSIDVVAGVTARAPKWMQAAGLEWLFRLLQEPGRMWRRYLRTNSIFLWLVLKDVTATFGDKKRPALDQ